VLRQVRRFFRSCEFLVSHPARPDSWVDRVKQAYHQRELQMLPAEIATWGAQIDQKRFPQNSAEKVKALTVRLQLLAFRIEDLLSLRSSSHAELVVRDLGDQVGSWRELIEQAFHAWSGAGEADRRQGVHERLSGQLAQLNPRVEEEVSRIQTSETGDAAGEGFYRVLGAFRGVTRAGLAYDERSRQIDWDAWQEEQFA